MVDFNPVDFIKIIGAFIEKLKGYRPELKSFRINYQDRTTELKLLLTIPSGLRRHVSSLEIPASDGYAISEVFDAVTLNRINLKWKLKNNNWVADTNELLNIDKYFVIMKGQVSTEALDQIVKLYCPQDPKRTDDLDVYWIDSAIKDVSILEKIYDELAVDRVSTTVNVGLERQFSSSIPFEIKEYFRTRAEADIHIASRDREPSYKAFRNLKIAQRNIGTLSPSDVYNLTYKVLTPSVFLPYLKVDSPFRITTLTPIEGSGWYPEKIGVGVQTDLDFRMPAAHGELSYRKIEFAGKLNEMIEKLPGLPRKKKK